MSDGTPTVGLALIARDEQNALPGLLESVAGAFDQVVLVDTGSRDDTVGVFERWAADQTLPGGFRVERFEWCDDFAAARNYADSLLETDWRSWADCDDTIVGAEHLRTLAARADPRLGQFLFQYDYAFGPQGQLVCVLRRERLVRAGWGSWVGRVHEAQVVQGAAQMVDPGLARWVHRKQFVEQQGGGGDRNLRILRKWVRDEPRNPTVLSYLGTEEAARGRHKRAVGYYRRYLRENVGWSEARAQVHRKLAASLLALGQAPDAMRVAQEALNVEGAAEWPDTRLSMAQASYHQGHYTNAERYAREALELGAPDTLLIINPLDYSFEPRFVLAAALAAQGRFDEAVQVGEEAQAILPDHPELNRHMGFWRVEVKREFTARTIVGMAQTLVAHDEQLKALALLEQAVPYYAVDHPEVVAWRSTLRERVAPLLTAAPERYEGGTEDGMPVEVAAQLPRAHFLERGIRDQLKEAA